MSDASTTNDDTQRKDEDSQPSFRDKVQAKKATVKDMKVSELKLKLMAKGVLTSTFCEKDEFVSAYAELLVKEEEAGSNRNGLETQGISSSGLTGFGLASADTSFPVVVQDASDDDDDDDSEQGRLIDQMPPVVLERIDTLKGLHTEYEEMMKEYLVERAQLEAKFHQKTDKLFQKRRDIVVSGNNTVPADTTEANQTTSSKTDSAEQQKTDDGKVSDSGLETTKQQDDKSMEIVGIPKFWVVALTQMPVTASMIKEDDVDCLGYLTNITCDNFEDGKGFQLNFEFEPNEYFTNDVLTKRYDVPNLLLADEPILSNVQGCDIKWKDGKSLTQRKVTKQQRGTGKNAGQTRTVTKMVPTESFFKFFTPPKLPTSLLDSTTEEEVMQLEEAYNLDYDVAQALRSHIVPKAIQWYLGDDAMEQEIEAMGLGDGEGSK